MERWDRRKYRGEGLPTDPIMNKGKPYSGLLYDPKRDAVVYIEDGLFHRIGGPAFEFSDGSQLWAEYGLCHRIGGPAIVQSGWKEWLVNGKHHRMDGPARVWDNRPSEWWVDGQKIDIVSILGHMPSVPLTTEQQVILALSA